MSVEVHKLSNGATALIDPIPTTQAIAVDYTFNRGARHERKHENGIAHFIEHMAFKGTERRTSRQLLEEIDFHGLKANAHTSQDETSYSAVGVADKFSIMNDILSDMAMHMSFPGNHLETERGVVIGEIRKFLDNSSGICYDAYKRTAFPNHPYGREILGPIHHIERFQRSDLQDFQQRNLHGNNLIVSVAGNVDPAKILQELEQTAGQMRSGKSISIKKPGYRGGFEFVDRPQNESVDVMMGFQAFGYNHAQVLPLTIMSKILGGGFSSRLFEEVRGKNGLGYVVYAGSSLTYDAGTMMLGANVNKGAAVKLTEIFVEQVKRIQDEDVSDLELQSVKNGLKSSLVLDNDSVVGRRNSNKYGMMFKGKITTDAEYLAKVDAVTQEDIRKAAQKVFSGTSTLSVVGPASSFPDYDKIVRSLDQS